MVYKSLNGLAPNYLSSKFIQRSDVNTSYNSHDSDNKLAIPLPRSNHYKNSFAIVVQFLWSSLPSAVRQATSLTSFRRFLINSDTAFMYFSLIVSNILNYRRLKVNETGTPALGRPSSRERGYYGDAPPDPLQTSPHMYRRNTRAVKANQELLLIIKKFSSF